MPTVDEKGRGVPVGTRFAQGRIDVPGSAIKAVRGRTRALQYAYDAIDRAAVNWFQEFREFPDWEDMQITVEFTSFEVIAEINDKFAHEFD